MVFFQYKNCHVSTKVSSKMLQLTWLICGKICKFYRKYMNFCISKKIRVLTFGITLVCSIPTLSRFFISRVVRTCDDTTHWYNTISCFHRRIQLYALKIINIGYRVFENWNKIDKNPCFKWLNTTLVPSRWEIVVTLSN